jgi:glycosyltransferase involved in cell wall biosynthesis
MKRPQISVVMTVYNEERFLPIAIESILRQTFENFELIIIDDASTDHTSDVLKQYMDERIILLRNEQNSGPYVSANKGISIAKGEFIARHDADDLSHSERFERQINYLVNNRYTGLVSSDFLFIDVAGKVIDSISLPTTNEALQTRLTEGNIFAQGSVIFRRSIFEQVGGYREYFPVSQDYDLWLRIAEASEVANIPLPLYQMRFHDKSISRNKRELQLACKQLAWFLATQRRKGEQENPIPSDVLSAYPPEKNKIFNESRGSTYLYYASGEYARAEESLNHALAMQRDNEIQDINWVSWASGRAILLADLRENTSEGAAFLEWFLTRYLGDREDKRIGKELAKFYAQQAFKAYKQEQKKTVLTNAFHAVRHDWRWLSNRGLWSITSKSIF